MDNTEITKPNKNRARTSKPVEEIAPDKTTATPVNSQAETRVIRRKSAKTQDAADASKTETVKITVPPSQTAAYREEVATVEDQGQNSVDFASSKNTSKVSTEPVNKLSVDEHDTIAQSPSGNEPSEPPAKVKRGKWIWLGILIILMMVLAGSGVGYASAMRARSVEENNQRLLIATTQFELGLVDQDQGKYEIAQERFEYVLSIYPDFPGIEEKLVEIGLLIAQNQAGNLIPTLGPEPTPTVAITIVPTKSTGSTTLLFNQAKAQMEGQDWEGLYTTLSAMREIDPAYKAIEVDGMWYLALRNRGIWQIQNGHLEPGMYSFALAKQIAPLDADAESYQEWARMYLNAGSNWMVDWYSAVQGFATLYPLVPQLRDASGITVTQRYARALIGYGDYLQANYDFCGAASTYRQASSIYAEPSLPEKITQADEYCAHPPPTPTPTLDPNAPTPTPTP